MNRRAKDLAIWYEIRDLHAPTDLGSSKFLHPSSFLSLSLSLSLCAAKDEAARMNAF